MAKITTIDLLLGLTLGNVAEDKGKHVPHSASVSLGKYQAPEYYIVVIVTPSGILSLT